jgi:hypothetical protein
MSNYFDYVLEESIPQNYEEPMTVYNEMDATMCEFDSYVQEGVGMKILIGVGILAALGGLIALIIKCFSNKSSSSASNKTRAAKKALRAASSKGVTELTISVPIEATQERVEELNKFGEMYTKFLDEYHDQIQRIIEAKNTDEAILTELKSVGKNLLAKKPEIAKLLNNPEELKKLTSSVVASAKEKVTLEKAEAAINTTMDGIKKALNVAKASDTRRSLISKTLSKLGIEQKATDAIFEKITKKFVSIITNFYNNAEDISDDVIGAVATAINNLGGEETTETTEAE